MIVNSEGNVVWKTSNAEDNGNFAKYKIVFIFNWSDRYTGFIALAFTVSVHSITVIKHILVFIKQKVIISLLPSI